MQHVDYKYLICVHCQVYKFYKLKSLELWHMGTVRVSLRVLGFIKFLDSIMHGYNYYTILVKCTCCLAHLRAVHAACRAVLFNSNKGTYIFLSKLEGYSSK